MVSMTCLHAVVFGLSLRSLEEVEKAHGKAMKGPFAAILCLDLLAFQHVNAHSKEDT